MPGLTPKPNTPIPLDSTSQVVAEWVPMGEGYFIQVWNLGTPSDYIQLVPDQQHYLEAVLYGFYKNPAGIIDEPSTLIPLDYMRTGGMVCGKWVPLGTSPETYNFVIQTHDGTSSVALSPSQAQGLLTLLLDEYGPPTYPDPYGEGQPS